MQFDFAMVLAFAVAAVGFVLANLLLGALVRPKFPDPEKDVIYECGERPIGRAWFNFNPRFYIVALVFVIFEVEVALTIPVALVFREWVFKDMGWVALAEILVFIGILFVGLVWLWVRRDLEWIRRLDLRPGRQAADQSR
ncbi:MAG: NADH-quinone oxidoreductase subunit A [Myxococcales bacterium]|nr:NADH-quinone oxidoreductase subunit A [Myxococcales bacterium]